VYHHLPEACCKNDSIAVEEKNRVSMLNAAVASVYGHKKVERHGGGTYRFQKSLEPFQSGTPRIRRTNLVLIRLADREEPICGEQPDRESAYPSSAFTREKNLPTCLTRGIGRVECVMLHGAGYPGAKRNHQTVR
jgi:hypothetical protein